MILEMPLMVLVKIYDPLNIVLLKEGIWFSGMILALGDLEFISK